MDCNTREMSGGDVRRYVASRIYNSQLGKTFTEVYHSQLSDSFPRTLSKEHLLSCTQLDPVTCLGTFLNHTSLITKQLYQKHFHCQRDPSKELEMSSIFYTPYLHRNLIYLRRKTLTPMTSQYVVVTSGINCGGINKTRSRAFKVVLKHPNPTTTISKFSLDYSLTTNIHRRKSFNNNRLDERLHHFMSSAFTALTIFNLLEFFQWRPFLHSKK